VTGIRGVFTVGSGVMGSVNSPGQG
jgi:hypothetical protein